MSAWSGSREVKTVTTELPKSPMARKCALQQFCKIIAKSLCHELVPWQRVVAHSMQVFIDLMLLLPSFSSSTYGVNVLGSSTFLSQYDPSDFSSLSLSLSSLNLRSKTIHYQRQLRFLTWVEKEMKIRGRKDNGASNCYSRLLWGSDGIWFLHLHCKEIMISLRSFMFYRMALKLENKRGIIKWETISNHESGKNSSRIFYTDVYCIDL